MSKHKDRELLDELEALGEIIEWLENSERCDLGQAPESISCGRTRARTVA